MNKRGQGEAMTLFTAFEIIIIVIFFGILAFIGTNFDYVSQASEIYAEKDLELMASTISFSPGETTYNYSLKKIYAVDVQEDKINVIRSGEEFKEFYEYYNLTLYNENGAFKAT